MSDAGGLKPRTLEQTLSFSTFMTELVPYVPISRERVAVGDVPNEEALEVDAVVGYVIVDECNAFLSMNVHTIQHP